LVGGGGVCVGFGLCVVVGGWGWVFCFRGWFGGGGGGGGGGEFPAAFCTNCVAVL